jgi:hypothetical protein
MEKYKICGKWIWDYPDKKRPAILDKLTSLESVMKVIILKSRKEITEFLTKQLKLNEG